MASGRGEAGEERACRYLEGQGLRVVCRNYRCRVGEIDIVAAEGDVRVFVEVKERGGRSHGAGFEAVTASKRRRIVAAARQYAARHGLTEAALRFDVISIDRGDDGLPRVRHDRGAFDADGR